MCEQAGSDFCVLGAFDSSGHAGGDLLERTAISTEAAVGGCVLSCIACEDQLVAVRPDSTGGYELAVTLSSSTLSHE